MMLDVGERAIKNQKIEKAITGLARRHFQPIKINDRINSIAGNTPGENKDVDPVKS